MSTPSWVTEGRPLGVRILIKKRTEENCLLLQFVNGNIAWIGPEYHVNLAVTSVESLIHSCNRYLLRLYYVPHVLLGAGTMAVTQRKVSVECQLRWGS